MPKIIERKDKDKDIVLMMNAKVRANEIISEEKVKVKLLTPNQKKAVEQLRHMAADFSSFVLELGNQEELDKIKKSIVSYQEAIRSLITVRGRMKIEPNIKIKDKIKDRKDFFELFATPPEEKDSIDKKIYFAYSLLHMAMLIAFKKEFVDDPLEELKKDCDALIVTAQLSKNPITRGESRALLGDENSTFYVTLEKYKKLLKTVSDSELLPCDRKVMDDCRNDLFRCARYGVEDELYNFKQAEYSAESNLESDNLQKKAIDYFTNLMKIDEAQTSSKKANSIKENIIELIELVRAIDAVVGLDVTAKQILIKKLFLTVKIKQPKVYDQYFIEEERPLKEKLKEISNYYDPRTKNKKEEDDDDDDDEIDSTYIPNIPENIIEEHKKALKEIEQSINTLSRPDAKEDLSAYAGIIRKNIESYVLRYAKYKEKYKEADAIRKEIKENQSIDLVNEQSKKKAIVEWYLKKFTDENVQLETQQWINLARAMILECDLMRNVTDIEIKSRGLNLTTETECASEFKIPSFETLENRYKSILAERTKIKTKCEDAIKPLARISELIQPSESNLKILDCARNIQELIEKKSEHKKNYESFDLAFAEFDTFYPPILNDDEFTKLRDLRNLHSEKRKEIEGNIDTAIEAYFNNIKKQIREKVVAFENLEGDIKQKIQADKVFLSNSKGISLSQYLVNLRNTNAANQLAISEQKVVINEFKKEISLVLNTIPNKSTEITQLAKIAALEAALNQDEKNAKQQGKEIEEKIKKIAQLRYDEFIKKCKDIQSSLIKYKGEIEQLDAKDDAKLAEFLYKKDELEATLKAIQSMVEEDLSAVYDDFAFMRQLSNEKQKWMEEKDNKAKEYLDIFRNKCSENLKVLQERIAAQKKEVAVYSIAEVKVTIATNTPGAVFTKIDNREKCTLFCCNAKPAKQRSGYFEYAINAKEKKIWYQEPNSTDFILVKLDEASIIKTVNTETAELEQLSIYCDDKERVKSIALRLFEYGTRGLNGKGPQDILDAIDNKGIGLLIIEGNKFDKIIAAAIIEVYKENFKIDYTSPDFAEKVAEKIKKRIEEAKIQQPKQEDLLSKLGVTAESRQKNIEQRCRECTKMLQVFAKKAGTQDIELNSDEIACLQSYAKNDPVQIEAGNDLATKQAFDQLVGAGKIEFPDIDRSKLDDQNSEELVVRNSEYEKLTRCLIENKVGQVTYRLGKELSVDLSDLCVANYQSSVYASEITRIKFTNDKNLQKFSTEQLGNLRNNLRKFSINLEEIIPSEPLTNEAEKQKLTKEFESIKAENQLFRFYGYTKQDRKMAWSDFWKRRLSGDNRILSSSQAELKLNRLALYGECEYDVRIFSAESIDGRAKKLKDTHRTPNTLIVKTGKDYFDQLLASLEEKNGQNVGKELYINSPIFDNIKSLSEKSDGEALSAYKEAQVELQKAYLTSLTTYLNSQYQTDPKEYKHFPFSAIRLELSSEFLGSKENPNNANILILQNLLKAIALRGSAIKELKIDIVDLSNGDSKQFKDLEDNQYKALQETLEDDSECRFDITINAGEPPSKQKTNLTNAIMANRRKDVAKKCLEVKLEVAQVKEQKKEEEKPSAKAEAAKKFELLRSGQLVRVGYQLVGKEPSKFRTVKDYTEKTANQIDATQELQAQQQLKQQSQAQQQTQAEAQQQSQAQMNAQNSIMTEGVIKEKEKVFSYDDFIGNDGQFSVGEINKNLIVDEGLRNDIDQTTFKRGAAELWEKIISPSHGKIEGSIVFATEGALKAIAESPYLYKSAFDRSNLPRGFGLTQHIVNGKEVGFCLCYNGAAAKPDRPGVVEILPELIKYPKAMEGDIRQLDISPGKSALKDPENGKYYILAIRYDGGLAGLKVKESYYPILVQNNGQEFYIEKPNATPIIINTPTKVLNITYPTSNYDESKPREIPEVMRHVGLNGKELLLQVQSGQEQLGQTPAKALRESAYTFSGLVLGGELFTIPIPIEYKDWVQKQWVGLLTTHMQQRDQKHTELFKKIAVNEIWQEFIGLKPTSMQDMEASPAFARKIIALLKVVQYSGLEGLDLFLRRLINLKQLGITNKLDKLYANFEKSFIEGRLSLTDMIKGPGADALDKICKLQEPQLTWWYKLSEHHTEIEFGVPTQDLASLYAKFEFFLDQFKVDGTDSKKPELPTYPTGLKINVNMISAIDRLHAIISSAGTNATEQLKNLEGLDLSVDGAYHATTEPFKYHFFTPEMDLQPGSKQTKYLVDSKLLNENIENKEDVEAQATLFYRFLGRCEVGKVNVRAYNSYKKLINNLKEYNENPKVVDNNIKVQLLAILAEVTTGRGSEFKVDENTALETLDQKSSLSFNNLSSVLANFTSPADTTKLKDILKFIRGNFSSWGDKKPTLQEVSALISLLKDIKDINPGNRILADRISNNISVKMWSAVKTWGDNKHHISAENLLNFAEFDKIQQAILTKIAALARASGDDAADKRGIDGFKEELRRFKNGDSTGNKTNYALLIRYLSFIKSDNSKATFAELTLFVKDNFGKSLSGDILKAEIEGTFGFDHDAFNVEKNAEYLEAPEGELPEDTKKRLAIVRIIEAIENKYKDLQFAGQDNTYKDPRGISYTQHSKQIEDLGKIYNAFEKMRMLWPYNDFSAEVFKNSPCFKQSAVADLLTIFNALTSDAKQVYFPQDLFKAIFSEKGAAINPETAQRIEKIITLEKYNIFTIAQKAKLIRLAKFDLRIEETISVQFNDDVYKNNPAILDKALELFTQNFTAATAAAPKNDKIVAQTKGLLDTLKNDENILKDDKIARKNAENNSIRDVIFNRVQGNVAGYNKLLGLFEKVSSTNKKDFLKIIAISYLGDNYSDESVNATLASDAIALLQDFENKSPAQFAVLVKLYEKRPYPSKDRLIDFLRLGNDTDRNNFLANFKKDPSGRRYSYNGKDALPARDRQGNLVSGMDALQYQFTVDQEAVDFIESIENMLRTDDNKKQLFKDERENLRDWVRYIYSVGYDHSLTIPGIFTNKEAHKDYSRSEDPNKDFSPTALRQPAIKLSSEQLLFLISHYQALINPPKGVIVSRHNRLCAQLELQAVLNECYQRNTGLMPTPQQTVVVILNTMLHENTNILNRLFTSEGKSLVMSLTAANLRLQGYDVLSTIEDQSLSDREEKEQRPFNEFINQASISASSSTSYAKIRDAHGAYITPSQANLSELGQLASGNHIHPKTIVLVDESHVSTREDTTEQKRAVASGSGDGYHNEYEWIYKYIIRYVQDKNNEQYGKSPQEDADHLRRYIIDELTKEKDYENAEKVLLRAGKLDDFKLSAWIDAACHVIKFKENVNYETTEETIKIGNTDLRIKKALVLVGHKPKIGCSFSDGRQQMLCALLNETEKGDVKFLIPPESEAEILSGTKSFFERHSAAGFDMQLSNGKNPDTQAADFTPNTYVIHDNEIYYIDSEYQPIKDEKGAIIDHWKNVAIPVNIKDKKFFDADPDLVKTYKTYDAYRSAFNTLKENFKKKCEEAKAEKNFAIKLSRYDARLIDDFTGHVQTKPSIHFYTATPGEKEDLDYIANNFNAYIVGYKATTESKLSNNGYAINFKKQNIDNESFALAGFLKQHKQLTAEEGKEFTAFMNAARFAQFDAIFANAKLAKEAGRPSLIICPDDAARSNFSGYLNEYFIYRYKEEYLEKNSEKRKLPDEELKKLLKKELDFLQYSKGQDAAEFTEKAGKRGIISIADPSYGCGVDIKLEKTGKNGEKSVNDLGGLNLIATYVMQFRTTIQTLGRSARKGDSGSAEIILSEDEITQIWNGFTLDEKQKLILSFDFPGLNEDDINKKFAEIQLKLDKKAQLENRVKEFLSQEVTLALGLGKATFGADEQENSAQEKAVLNIISKQQQKMQAALDLDKLKSDYGTDLLEQFNVFYYKSQRNIAYKISEFAGTKGVNTRDMWTAIKKSNQELFTGFTGRAQAIMGELKEFKGDDNGKKSIREQFQDKLGELAGKITVEWEKTKTEIYTKANDIAKSQVPSGENVSFTATPKDEVNIGAIIDPCKYLQAYENQIEADAEARGRRIKGKTKGELTTAVLNEEAVYLDLGCPTDSEREEYQLKAIALEIEKIVKAMSSDDRKKYDNLSKGKKISLEERKKYEELRDQAYSLSSEETRKYEELAKLAQAQVPTVVNNAANIKNLLVVMLQKYHNEAGNAKETLYFTKLSCLHSGLTKQIAKFGINKVKGKEEIEQEYLNAYIGAHLEVFYPAKDLDEEIIGKVAEITAQLQQDLAHDLQKGAKPITKLIEEFNAGISAYLERSNKELAKIEEFLDQSKNQSTEERKKLFKLRYGAEEEEGLVEALYGKLVARKAEIVKKQEFLTQFAKVAENAEKFKGLVDEAILENIKFFNKDTIKTKRIDELNAKKPELERKRKELLAILERLQKEITALKQKNAEVFNGSSNTSDLKKNEDEILKLETFINKSLKALDVDEKALNEAITERDKKDQAVQKEITAKETEMISIFNNITSAIEDYNSKFNNEEYKPKYKELDGLKTTILGLRESLIEKITELGLIGKNDPGLRNDIVEWQKKMLLDHNAFVNGDIKQRLEDLEDQLKLRKAADEEASKAIQQANEEADELYRKIDEIFDSALTKPKTFTQLEEFLTQYGILFKKLVAIENTHALEEIEKDYGLDADVEQKFNEYKKKFQSKIEKYEYNYKKLADVKDKKIAETKEKITKQAETIIANLDKINKKLVAAKEATNITADDFDEPEQKLTDDNSDATDDEKISKLNALILEAQKQSKEQGKLIEELKQIGDDDSELKREVIGLLSEKVKLCEQKREVTGRLIGNLITIVQKDIEKDIARVELTQKAINDLFTKTLEDKSLTEGQLRGKETDINNLYQQVLMLKSKIKQANKDGNFAKIVKISIIQSEQFENEYQQKLAQLKLAIQKRHEADQSALKILQDAIGQLKKIYENELNHLTVADDIPASSENKDTKEAFDKLSVVELNKIMDKLLDNTKGGILANLEEQNKVITSIIKNKQGFDMQIMQLINDGIRKYNDVVEKITECKGMLERRMSFIGACSK